MYSGIKRILELLYPRHCPLCDGLLERGEPLICRRCGKTLRFLEEPLCFRCGKPLQRQEQEVCRDCGSKSHSYDRGFAPFPYRGVIRDSVMRFKYGGRAEYAAFYATAIAAHGKRLLEHWKPEVLIPVPVHRERLLKRGYNQAEELARQLSQKLSIPAEYHAVSRIRNTRAQKELNDLERKRNLAHAFAMAEGYQPPERILLVDDIYTTGSTIDALAALFRQRGAAHVYFASICVSPGDS